MSHLIRGSGADGICMLGAAALVLLLSAGTVSAQQDLIVNGTFEGGWMPDGFCDLVEPDADSLPNGWSCYETFSSALPETSLLTLFPFNGPSLPGVNALEIWRGDQCHRSGDWTSIEQTINADVSACTDLKLDIDVMLLPLVGVHSHNLGGSGHVAGPCDPSGYEYPLTVMIDYTDVTGAQRCWQYGWYQYPVTQAGRTDPGCVSGFDNQNANPNPAVSRPLPTGQWFANAFDLFSVLPNVKTVRDIRVGGSGWSFYGALDNVQMLCSNPCVQSPYPQCDAPCPGGQSCEPDPASGACRCVLPCTEATFPGCAGECPTGETCVPDGTDLDCQCELLPCEQSPYPECGGPCPTGLQCVPDAIGGCRCEALPCEQTYPMCDGPCPPGQACVTGLLNNCLCEALPCEQTYPTCDGPCPPGQACVTGLPNNCLCEALPCEQTYPMCNGPCPTGQICVSDTLVSACVCRTPSATYYKADWPDYAPSGMPDFEQLHAFPITQNNPRTMCGPTALLDSLWWFDSEMECDTHHTTGDAAETEPNFQCSAADTLGETPSLRAMLVGGADADWYRFEVPRGGSHSCNVIVSTYALANLGDADTRLSLYDSCSAVGVPGNLLFQNDDYRGTPQSEISSSGLAAPVVLPPGRYYLEVDSGPAGIAGGPSTLTLGLDCYPLIERWIDTAPDDHSEYNVEQSIASLAVCANTDDPPLGRWRGTRLEDMHLCVDSWLEAKGLRSSYTDQTVLMPAFDEVEDEVERSEDVVLLLGFYWQAGPQTWVRCGGHYVTAAGVDSENLTITLSDPYFNNAEPPLAGNGAPGRVRGPNHVDHAPGLNPPPDHDDALNVSHDQYAVGPGLPGIAQWTLPAYATLGHPTTCEDVANWCLGSDYGQNPQGPEPQAPCPSPGLPVIVAAEAMVDVSPVQTPICLYLDPLAVWPDNLRMDRAPCEPVAPPPVSYDVIRGKHCGLALSQAVPQVDLGHVQCLYDDVAAGAFDDASPDDDGCFGLWFYLVRQSGDPSYGQGSGGDEELPSTGGCP